MKFFFRLIVISMTSFCFMGNANAQSYADFARTFSQTSIGGTSRIQAIGGAQTSLGGDVSSILSNPAGLGFYNRSEFSITPSLNFYNAESRYLGNTLEDNSTNFNFGTIGVVFNHSKANTGSSGWRGGSFGVSLSQVNDYHNSISYGGSNDENDFVGFALDGIFYDNNQIAFADIYTELAFNVYLLDEFYDPETDEFFLDRYNIESGFPVQQRETVTTSGSTSQVTFAYGGNFSDKFYIGANIGISILDYQVDRLFVEMPTGTALDNLVLSEVREISGTGFNIGLGAIYRPVNQLTLGLSYRSPTFYSLEDASIVDLFADFPDSSDVNYAGIENTPTNYRLRTPGHINAGATYFFGKHGFISGDISYLDYSKNHYGGGNGSFDLENEDINETFESTINYRIGGEYRFNIFRFRAGYALYGDPVKGVDDLDRSRQVFSAGFGVKWKQYGLDLAVINSLQDSSIRPYGGAAPLAVTENSVTSAMLTFSTTW